MNEVCDGGRVFFFAVEMIWKYEFKYKIYLYCVQFLEDNPL